MTDNVKQFPQGDVRAIFAAQIANAKPDTCAVCNAPYSGRQFVTCCSNQCYKEKYL